VSDNPHRVVTQAALDRLHLARRRGGQCAACGKALHPLEPVFWEPVVVDIGRSTLGLRRYTTTLEAPVATECASPAFRNAVSGHPPERCAGCGRGVYYLIPNSRRQRPACSQRCRGRAHVAGWARKG
jgi:hypothetical protein